MPEIAIAKRAFQLAREGGCCSVDDIRRKLSAEGYDAVHAHLAGPTMNRQLRDALAGAAAH